MVSIIHIVDSLRSGGKERRLVEILRGFKDNTDIHLVLIVLSEEIHYKDVFNLGIPIYVFNQRLRKYPLFFSKIVKVIKSHNGKILQAWGPIELIYSMPVAKFLKIKVINNLIVDAPLKLQPFIKFIAKISFPFSNVILANSYAGLNSYHVSRKNSQCIYNGFDFKRLKLFKSSEVIRSELEISTKFVVGMIASYHINKDYNTFLKAAKLVLRKREDVTFITFGSGDYSIFQNYSNGSKGLIKLFGRRDNIEEVVSILSIGVLTSNSQIHGEGISNSIMEYMAFSKPVIATNCGGTPEIVVDNFSGYLINDRDEIALSEKIDLLLDDEKLRYSMGQESLKIVRSKFEINKMISQYRELYNSMMIEL